MPQAPSTVSRIVLPSVSRTASGVSAKIPATKATLQLAVEVTVDGGGTLDIEIEHSVDGTNWNSAGVAQTFTQFAAVGFEAKNFPVQARYWRVNWTIVTGPFTFEMSAIEYDSI